MLHLTRIVPVNYILAIFSTYLPYLFKVFMPGGIIRSFMIIKPITKSPIILIYINIRTTRNRQKAKRIVAHDRQLSLSLIKT